MRKHLALLLLFSASVTALARDSGEHWIEVRSAHFTVLTDSNEKQGRRIASQFERMRSLFHMLLPNAAADSASPIIVLALKDKKAFQSLEPAEYLAKGQLDLAGLFLRAQDKTTSCCASMPRANIPLQPSTTSTPTTCSAKPTGCRCG